MVEKIEKKEKKAETDAPLEFVLGKINRNPAAKKAWKKLTEAGVDQAEMAENLFRYCGGTKEQLQGGLKVARQFRDSFDEVINQARVTANAIEKMLRNLRDIGRITIHGNNYDELPSSLREFANELVPLARAFKKSIAVGARLEKDGRVTGGRRVRHSIFGGWTRNLWDRRV